MAEGGPPVRLLTWNVHGLRGDRQAMARVLRSARPDVVCLQEAAPRFRPTPRLAGLARASGLLYVAGGAASAGTALLCSDRTAVDRTRAFRLPVRGWRAPRRGAVVAVAAVAGESRVAVACVHLPLDAAARLDHARRVRDLVTPIGLPAVIAGDLNEAPGGPCWLAFAPLALDPWPDAARTFPARGPRHRIDAVLVGEALRARPDPGWRMDVDDVMRASDHLPVLAVLEPAAPA